MCIQINLLTICGFNWVFVVSTDLVSFLVSLKRSGTLSLKKDLLLPNECGHFFIFGQKLSFSAFLSLVGCEKDLLSFLFLVSIGYSLVCFRASDRLKKVSSKYVAWSAMAPRAFMSSSISTEAVHESKVSKEYGSDQIQVELPAQWTCTISGVLLHSYGLKYIFPNF